jgi:cellobiose transport system substrate-binding protein
VKSRALRRIGLIAGVATTSALVMAGCTANEPTPGGTTGVEDVTLTVTTFGTMGLDSLYQKYMDENENVTIKATNLEDGGSGRDDLFNKMGAGGAGLTDVVAVEEGWLGAVSEVAEDFFEDLRDYGIEDSKDAWLPWKYAQGTTTSGYVFGAGLDIGPQGLCYRGDLFEAAGLPSDREEVAELFGGADATWDRFFEVAGEYVAASGKPFYHNPSFFWNSFVNQQAEGYYKSDGVTLNVEGNDALKSQLGKIVESVKAGHSAGLPGWGVAEQAKNDEFAVYMCPSWMLGVVSGYYDAGTTGTGWDFADVLPGGSANWGGAFLGVASNSKHKEEAAKLALWLAQPEQQAATFEAAGPFPSTYEGQKIAAEVTNPFFNDAPTGQILASRAEGVVAQVKGPDDSVIQDDVFGPVLDQINAGDLTDVDSAWNAAIDLLKSLVR